MLSVQRQAFIDLVRYDSLKVYVQLVEAHNDTLHAEVRSLYKTINLKNNENILLQNRLTLVEADQQLNKQTIALLRQQAKKNRLWVGLGKFTVKIILPASIALTAYSLSQ